MIYTTPRMLRLSLPSLIAFLVLIVPPFFPQSSHATDVDQLVKHIDKLWRGVTSKATMSMTVQTQRYKRSMTMDAWSYGKNYSLVVIREPIKDRNVATLKVEENIWNYLPKINRVTKVPSSMMAGSWMGSHFTNDDLVKDSTYEDDFIPSITFEGEREGRSIYEITLQPKPDAAVVWGKVVMLLDQSSLAPYRALYYDEEGILVRTMIFDQTRVINERTIPMRMTLQPEDKPKESTIVIYKNIEFDIPIKTSFFSLQNLKRRR